jgi:integrase
VLTEGPSQVPDFFCGFGAVCTRIAQNAENGRSIEPPTSRLHLKAGGSWYGRWRDNVIEDGQVVRKQCAAKLADVCERFRTKADVRPLLAEKLRPINEGKTRPESTLPVAQFVKLHYLPFVEENFKASTRAGYKSLWEMYLAPRLTGIALRDFRTVDAAVLLAEVHRVHGVRLRPGEARGACWEDYDGKKLTVRQSVWHTHTTTPKTNGSAKPVPIIEPLTSILAELHAADKSPCSGPILRGPSGKPLDLNNLGNRVVIPILRKAGIAWHGWYALRRGVATAVTALSTDSLAAKGLQRHSSVSTTEGHCIKDVPESTLQAMKRLETLCKERAIAEGIKPN